MGEVVREELLRKVFGAHITRCEGVQTPGQRAGCQAVRSQVQRVHGRSRLSGFEEQKGICGQDIINKESMA